MGVAVRCMRAALRTTTGTQDFTVSGIGTVKAAMFIVTSATADGTLTDHSVWAIGVTDGTNHRNTCSVSEHSVSASDCKTTGSTDQVIQIIDPTSSGGGSVSIEAGFDSFITDGVRIDVTTTDSTAYLVSVILWAGSNVTALVGQFLTSGAAGDRTHVSVPFKTEHLIMVPYLMASTFDDTIYDENFSVIGLGGLNNNNGLDERSVGQWEDDGLSTTIISGHTNSRLYRDGGSAGGATARVNDGDVDSAGFVITTGGINEVANLAVGFLAINYGGALNVWAREAEDLSPTSTGDHDVTEPGFTPQFVMLGVFPTGLGIFDATNEFCSMVIQKGAVSTTNTKSRSSSQAVFTENADGTTQYDGTFSTFLGTGYRINYSTVVAATDDWSALAIEEEPTLQYELENYRWRDDDGNEANATWLQSEEVNITREKETNTRLRTTIDSTGADPATATVTLQYIQKGDNISTEWRDVPLT